MRTILGYVGAFAALTIAVLVVSQLGEAIRDITPAQLHGPLSAAGAALVTATMICLAAFKAPPFSMSPRAWRTSMIAGLIAGLVLFCFYISDVQCRSTGRAGVSCSYKNAE